MTTLSLEIPKKYYVTQFDCNQYLINGELRTWTGGRSNVYSSIRTPNEQGEMEPTLLGSIPDMESETALEALEAADKAYQRGQGLWPTMKVSERLKCMHNFVEKMKLHREEVDLPLQVARTGTQCHHQYYLF